VGMFGRHMADRVGQCGWVLAVEADRAAAEAATGNLGEHPWASVLASPTERAVQDLVAAGERADLVVLDPPRSGAGAQVVRSIAALGPRAVVYVACDPAALARDLRTAAEEGLELVGLRVLDAFPMTHHVETLALLRPRPA
jgi:tRNA/tmRNA/rRNA uracil-C5-methylase (TrmA/RlmC/RlmD family)